jgi:hypothetical protein
MRQKETKSMSENYVEYERLARFLNLDEREKELDELLVNSANEYVRSIIDRDFEEDIPFNICEAILILFEDKKAFQKALNSDNAEKSTYTLSAETKDTVLDLIFRYKKKYL